MQAPGEQFAVEIVKRLPVKDVYADVAQPGVKQAGQFLEDLLKVAQLALAPVQYFAALQDRYRAFIDRSVRRVPEERRVAPAPQVLGPVLEGVRYEPEGTPIDEMFSQLLSRSMDADRTSEAHPAYPFIIRQLSDEEAKMLVQLRDERVRVNLDQKLDVARQYFHPPTITAHNFKELRFPGNLSAYIVHLRQLGRIVEEAMKTAPVLQAGVQIGNRHDLDVTLSDFGAHFVRAVLPVVRNP